MMIRFAAIVAALLVGQPAPAATLDFGDVEYGTSVTMSFSYVLQSPFIQGDGVNTPYFISGSETPKFVIIDNPEFTINGSLLKPISITFTPTALGEQTAMLIITAYVIAYEMDYFPPHGLQFANEYFTNAYTVQANVSQTPLPGGLMLLLGGLGLFGLLMKKWR